MQGKVSWQMIVLGVVCIILFSIGCGGEEQKLDVDTEAPEINMEVPEALIEMDEAYVVINIHGGTSLADYQVMAMGNDGVIFPKVTFLGQEGEKGGETENFATGYLLKDLKSDTGYWIVVTARDNAGNVVVGMTAFRTKL